jgi:hypothetical protein
VLPRTLLVFLAVVRACAAQDIPGFALYLHFDSTPSPLFVRTMKQELGLILTGFDLHWIGKNDSVPASKTYRRSFIVRFRGNCAVVPGQTGIEIADRVVLGDSILAGGSILPYSEIDCDRVLAFLRTANLAEVGQEARLGRASGRVLAHELYHVLLQTSAHSSKGLAKAVHSPSSLLSQSLQFEEGELQKMASKSRP